MGRWHGARTVRSLLGLGAAVLMALGCLALGDEQVPKGFSPDRYAQLWLRNPFTLVTPAAPQVVPSAFEKLALVSWFRAGSSVVVFVQNTETNEVQKVTTKPNPQGLRLVEVHPSSNPQGVEAVISNGNEQGAVRFRLEAPTVAPAPSAATAAAPVPNLNGVPNPAQDPATANLPGTQPGLSPNAANPAAAATPPYNAAAAANQMLNGMPAAQGRLGPGSYPRVPTASDFRRRRVLPSPGFSPPPSVPNSTAPASVP
ncbi:MAG: hypothetical protein JO069_05355 [Verrucomicrobia bacterium]|nr:hypothetical protein [Verrucomicrobiota bacterium]